MTKTVTFHLLRVGQYVRQGETCFALHGRRQEAPGPKLTPVTLHIDSRNCSANVADVLALAREGDTLTLSYEIAFEGLATETCLYSTATLLANLPGPRGMSMTGRVTCEGNHALLRS